MWDYIGEVEAWLSGGCNSWGLPEQAIRKLVEDAKAVPAEPDPILEDMTKAAHDVNVAFHAAVAKEGGFCFPHEGAMPGGGTMIVRGMTMRQWYAGQALAGMHARDTFDEGQATPEQRARLALFDADAMIAAEAPKP